MQVVHFDTQLQRSPNSWVRGTNTFLPPDIAVHWAREVPNSPRATPASAAAPAPRPAAMPMCCCNRPCAPALRPDALAGSSMPLQAHAMQQAAPALLGEHDFSSFRASGCQAKTPIKTLHRIDISFTPAGHAAMREDPPCPAATGALNLKAALFCTT